MRLVGAIRRAGRGIGGIGEVSDVVAFRFTVVDCPSRAPFRLLVARLIRWGVGDEPMRRMRWMRWTRRMRLASNVLETWREVRRGEARRDARREAEREAWRDER